MMLNLKKLNESFSDIYIPKKKHIEESINHCEDDDISECGILSDYLEDAKEYKHKQKLEDLRSESNLYELLYDYYQDQWYSYDSGEEAAAELDKIVAQLKKDFLWGDAEQWRHTEDEDDFDESLKEDWKDAYKQFEAELDRAFADGVVDPLAVEDRIKILYNKHRGDKDWDIAYMRWTNVNEDTKVDLTKKKGSMSNVLTNHKKELSEFKKLDDMISNIDKWFKDANIDTPASNRLLSKLKNAKDIKDAQFIVYNSILSGAGEKVLK